jgi:hypothetical protein
MIAIYIPVVKMGWSVGSVEFESVESGKAVMVDGTSGECLTWRRL